MLTKHQINIASYGTTFLMGVYVFYKSVLLHSINSSIMPIIVTILMMLLSTLGIIVELKKIYAPKKFDTNNEKSTCQIQYRSFLWVLPLFALVAGIYLTGFYVATFVFVASYIKMNGGNTKEACIFSISVPLFLYVTFSLLLQVEMHSGLLFEYINF